MSILSFIKYMFSPIVNFEKPPINPITKNNYTILSACLQNTGSLVQIRKDYFPVPDSCSTVEFKNDIYYKEFQLIEYYDLLAKIPEHIKKIVFNLHTYTNNINNLLENLPSHIEEIELINVFADGKEIFPNLNNLPSGLKKINIKNVKSPRDSYNFILVCDYKKPESLENYKFIQNFNIKLPFGCEFYLYEKLCTNPDDILIKFIINNYNQFKYNYNNNITIGQNNNIAIGQNNNIAIGHNVKNNNINYVVNNIAIGAKSNNYFI
jgi:hypothetical protein